MNYYWLLLGVVKLALHSSSGSVCFDGKQDLSTELADNTESEWEASSFGAKHLLQLLLC